MYIDWISPLVVWYETSFVSPYQHRTNHHSCKQLQKKSHYFQNIYYFSVFFIIVSLLYVTFDCKSSVFHYILSFCGVQDARRCKATSNNYLGYQYHLLCCVANIWFTLTVAQHFHLSNFLNIALYHHLYNFSF